MLASSGQTALLHFDHCRLTGTAPCRNSAEAAFLPHAAPADSPAGQVRDRPRLWQPLCFPGRGALLPGTRLFLTLSVLLSPPGSPLVLSCSADGLAPCFTERELAARDSASIPLQQTHACCPPLRRGQGRLSSSPRLTLRLPGFGCCLQGPFLFSPRVSVFPSQWNSSRPFFFPELFLEV